MVHWLEDPEQLSSCVAAVQLCILTAAFTSSLCLTLLEEALSLCLDSPHERVYAALTSQCSNG